jgi:hypothetical protein
MVQAEVDFLALDKPEDIRKLRSTEYTGGVFNEAQYIDKEMFDEATSRLRYPPKERRRDLARRVRDANAPDEDHWLAIMTGQVDLPPGLTDEEAEALGKWPEEWGFHIQPPALIENLDAHGRVTSATRSTRTPRTSRTSIPTITQADHRQDQGLDRLAADGAGCAGGRRLAGLADVQGRGARRAEVLKANPNYDIDVGLDFGRSAGGDLRPGDQQPRADHRGADRHQQGAVSLRRR